MSCLQRFVSWWVQHSLRVVASIECLYRNIARVGALTRVVVGCYAAIMG